MINLEQIEKEIVHSVALRLLCAGQDAENVLQLGRMVLLEAIGKKHLGKAQS